MPTLSNLYLFAYNSLQAFGWAVCLSRILSDFISTGTLTGAYASAGDLICLLQVSAFLEVIHGAIGLVPSGMLLPLMQWGGRTNVILVIVRQIEELQESPAVFITFTAWSLSEVIRYPHHALNCIGKCPYWIVYLRYTAFTVLYPTGESAEMWIMYRALSYIKKKNLLADVLFPSFPFLYHNFLSVLLPTYPFLWLKLYLHLFKQRQSKLGKDHEQKKKKKK
ncbi:very-long-chain (3R)-3-hydroxyacyl-CoA dehydratase 2 [Morus notabilis]|uniref:very-long-chain (3R)-3-hydroxyacyl-CoA dehydratase 2 n=1 Tax=Morus notabilis TaxID=981085 RepID=UPI000CECF924|nr:very-long-chain (3R)-3-hydroxyacyl-CoA dehydratase 2 [Morus notabilis]